MDVNARIPMSRRDAIGLLAVAPFAAHLPRSAPQPPRLRRVAFGFDHGLLVEPDGTLKSWSTRETNNRSGELGLGHTDSVEQYRLYTVPELRNVVGAGAARSISFALLADGRIFAWGEHDGMLGITPLEYLEVYADEGPTPKVPTEVAARVDAVDLAVGWGHTLALSRDGTVWAWGDGRNGRLGIGDLPIIRFKTHDPSAMSFQPFPMRVPGLSNVVAISAGGNHSMALLRDGSIRAWGGNRYGQLGDGTTVDRWTPVPVKTSDKAVAIACGSSWTSCAVLEDGRALEWGALIPATRPGATTSDAESLPVPVAGVSKGRAIVMGDDVTLVVTRAGTVSSWGLNQYKQLGHGAFTQRGLPPGMVTGLSGVHAVMARTHACIAILDDGRIMNWGVGYGSGGDSRTPVPLKLAGLDNG